MADIAFVATALAFFAVAFLYVLACERIVGRDAAVADDEPAASEATR